MKKIRLSILISIIAWGAIFCLPAHAQNDINKITDFKITQKTLFITPLLTKVFPGISFYYEKLNDGKNRISFDLNGEDLNVNNRFNILIKKGQSTKHASIEEIIEAMVRLKYYVKDSSNYNITVIKEKNKNPLDKNDTISYNYKAVFENNVFKEEINLFLLFDGTNFIKSSSSEGSLLDFSIHSYINEKKADAIVEIINNTSIHLN
jgi:hypothetical protein